MTEKRTRHVDPTSVPHALWHGTSVVAAAMILRENRMIHAQFEGPPGISLSSDIEVALDFGARGDERVAEDELGLEVMNRGGVVLCFDGKALAAQHPFTRHFYDRDEEAEWRLLADQITGIRRFLTGIFADADDLAWWKERLPDHTDAIDALAEMITACRDKAISFDPSKLPRMQTSG